MNMRIAAVDLRHAHNRDTLIYFADDLDELAEKAELAKPTAQAKDAP